MQSLVYFHPLSSHLFFESGLFVGFCVGEMKQSFFYVHRAIIHNATACTHEDPWIHTRGPSGSGTGNNAGPLLAVMGHSNPLPKLNVTHPLEVGLLGGQ